MSLTLKQATTIVEAALRRGRETSCAPLAVAVLDGGGHLKTFGREDGAGILRPQIALGKAWGALGMGVGSGRLPSASPTTHSSIRSSRRSTPCRTGGSSPCPAGC